MNNNQEKTLLCTDNLPVVEGEISDGDDDVVTGTGTLDRKNRYSAFFFI